jgi:hypothetical protein
VLFFGLLALGVWQGPAERWGRGPGKGVMGNINLKFYYIHINIATNKINIPSQKLYFKTRYSISKIHLPPKYD